MTDSSKDSEHQLINAARRAWLKKSMVAAAVTGTASVTGINVAAAAASNGNGSSNAGNAGNASLPFTPAANEGFPRPSGANEIWALNYAGNLFPGLRNGPALFAMMFPPTGIFIEDSGTLKVCDARNSVIRNVSDLGGVSVFSGSVQQYPFRDGAAGVATYNSPNDIGRLSTGEYVVGDRENNAIRRVSKDGSVTTIAGRGNCQNRYNGDQAIGTNARLNRPLTLQVSREHTSWHTPDTIYFADRDNHLIRKLVPNGDGSFALITLAGTAPTESDPASPLTYYPGHEDGPCQYARFRGACGLVLSDDERYLYVAERDNNVIRVIDLAEEMVGTYAGVVMVGQGRGDFADGAADQARFNGPSQIDIDEQGNLYLADRFNHRIRKITPSADPMKATEVSTYAGSGAAGRRSGPSSAAEFYEPWGLAYDRRTGLIYVGDTGNSRISVIGPYADIWPAFAQRLNTARLAEFQELMDQYMDYYRGSQRRDATLGSLASEGPVLRDL